MEQEKADLTLAANRDEEIRGIKKLSVTVGRVDCHGTTAKSGHQARMAYQMEHRPEDTHR